MLIGRYNLPNAITLTGVSFAVAGCIFSYHGQLGRALSCLIAAAFCDLYDGVVARKIGSSPEDRQFGAQLDSSADVICYGATPIIILLHSGFDDAVAHVMMLFYVACVVMRLACFNMVGTTRVGKHWYYSGLPVTYVAVVLPAEFVLRAYCSPVAFHGLIVSSLTLMAVLFVSTINIPKQRGAFYVVFPAIGAMLAGYWLLAQ
jgi:CDP-diacylglycerol---serine O-phosphatidyltransferase